MHFIRKETPSRKAGTGVSSAEPKASQPTFLYRNQGSRNALLSKCLGPGAPSGCHGAPTVKSPRIRHKQTTPPSPLRSRGPLYLFRFALLRRLLTAGFVRRGRGLNTGPLRKKICKSNFSSTRTFQ